MLLNIFYIEIVFALKGENMKATKRYEVKDRNFWTDSDWKYYLNQNFKTLKTRVKFDLLSQELKDIIIDGTGAATRPLLKKDANLKALGYDTFMIMLNVSPITSLKRNLTRNRQLLPTIITKTWKSVNTNIDIFREAFGNDFILIDNDPADAEIDYDPKEIKIRFFDTSKAKGKPKTPDQMAKKAKEVEQLNQDIIDLIQIEREYDTLEEAQAKIDRFLNE